jgi:hypothetical protein
MAWGDTFSGESLDEEIWDDDAVGTTYYYVDTNVLYITSGSTYSWIPTDNNTANQIQSLMELPEEFEISCRVTCTNEYEGSLGQFGVALVKDNGDVVAFVGYMDYEDSYNNLRKYCIAEADFDYKTSSWTQYTSDHEIIHNLGGTTSDYMDITFNKTGDTITISSEQDDTIGYFDCVNEPVHFAIVTGLYEDFDFMGIGSIGEITSDITDEGPLKPSSIQSAQSFGNTVVKNPFDYTNWSRRITKTINGSSDSILYNYQIVELDVDWDSNMKSNFGDIRFTDEYENELKYHLVSYTSSTSATFRIKVTSIPKSPSTTDIYMYYGNSSATSASSPEDVYEFYDDCAGTFGDKWNKTYGSNSGYNTVGGATAIKLVGSNDACYITGKENFDHPILIEFDGYLNDYIWLLRYAQSATPVEADGYRARFDGRTTYEELIDVCDGNTSCSTFGTNTDLTLSKTTWYPCSLSIDQSKFHTWIINGETGASGTDSTYTSGYIGFETTWNGYSGFKNIRVSKYTANPPTWGDWGTEEVLNDDTPTLTPSAIDSSETIGSIGIVHREIVDTFAGEGILDNATPEIIMVAINDSFSSEGILEEVTIPYSSCTISDNQFEAIALLTITIRKGDTLIDALINEDIKEFITPVTRY